MCCYRDKFNDLLRTDLRCSFVAACDIDDVPLFNYNAGKQAC